MLYFGTTVFVDVMLYSLIDHCRRFGRECCFHLQTTSVHSTTSQRTIILVVCSVTTSDLSKPILTVLLETKSESPAICVRENWTVRTKRQGEER
jgi:hypothetical protein